MKCILPLRSLVFLGTLCGLGLTVSVSVAAPLGVWRMDETTGAVAPNSVSGGTDGTLFNGPTWTTNADRGQVLAFDGSDDYVGAGNTPALAVGDDFSWVFWGYSQQGANNNVILGNRFDGAGNSWVKFTTSKFEYVPSGAANHVDYADVPANQWVHHAVVKSGSTLTYYRNGAAAGTATVTGAMPTLPLRMGGDPTAERWQGLIDDVGIFSQALSVSQVKDTMSGFFSSFNSTPAMSLADTFDGGSVDGAKWAVINQGLESRFGAGYNAPSVAGGNVTLGGTTSYSYWAGKTLASQNTFDVPAGGELRFTVDRVSLSGTGTGYRSSLWMVADDADYVHFSQNSEASSGFAFNANNNTPIGSGVNLSRADGLDNDFGNHRMTMVNDGAFVKMFVDGRWVGSQAGTFNSGVRMMLTGQARQAGDTVSAVFDNASVSTRSYLPIYDDFNSGSINPAKWNVILKGLENQGTFPGTLNAGVQDGELVIQGTTGNQYWYGVTLQSTDVFAPSDLWTFAVDRDALDRGGSSAVRSSVWLWADDDHFLAFSHNFGENGWQYNYADGTRVSGIATGGGVNIAAFDGLDSDPGRHEMKLVATPTGAGDLSIAMYLDGVLGATQVLNNWDGRMYRFMLSGMPRASGDSVFVAFDNVQMKVPEPATWALLSAGLLALAFARNRRLRQQ